MGTLKQEQSTINDKLGSRIRQKRLELGMSQQELVAGRYSEVYLSRVERNQMQPSEEFLVYLAARLNITVAVLSEGTSSRELTAKKVSKDEIELDFKLAQLALNTSNSAEARELLEQIETDKLVQATLPVYWKLRGQCELESGKIDLAITYLERAVSLVEVTPRPPVGELESIRNYLGLAYYRQKNYLRAVEQHQLAWQSLQKQHFSDNYLQMLVCYNLMKDYNSLENQEQMLLFQHETERLTQAATSLTQLATSYHERAFYYRETENWTLAKFNAEKSTTLYQTIEEMRLAALIKLELATNLLERQQLEQAQLIIIQVFQIGQFLKDNVLLASYHLRMAQLLAQTNQIEEATENVGTSLDLARQLDDKLLIAQALIQLAELQPTSKEHVEKTIEFFQEAIAVLEPIRDEAGTILKQAYFRYAKILEKTNKVEQAFEMYRKAFEYQA